MRIVLASAVLAAVVLSACAQEYGRGALDVESSGSGLGRGSLPPARHDGFALGGAWGLKLSLGWAGVDWDIGPDGGSEKIFAPQVSLFYKTTDNLDINFSTVFLSADDTDQLVTTKAEMTRLAPGLRYWINTQTRITPYIGGGLGYYLLDGTITDKSTSVKDAPGMFLEGGAAFEVSDAFFINADLTYDFLLGSADATIAGKDEDFDVKSLAFNLGASWMF